MQTDLNLTRRLRLSVLAAYLLVAFLVIAPLWPMALGLAAPMFAAILALNHEYYRHFARMRGPWFAVRVVPLHIVHHLCNGFSFVTGNALFHLRNALGWALPGSLPIRTATSNMDSGINGRRPVGV